MGSLLSLPLPGSAEPIADPAEGLPCWSPAVVVSGELPDTTKKMATAAGVKDCANVSAVTAATAALVAAAPLRFWRYRPL